MTTVDDILVAQGVGKQFGGFTALKDVTVSFARDKLSAIIGPNGAGKSTFFNVISGAFPPTSGRVSFEGRDITALRQHEYASLQFRYRCGSAVRLTSGPVLRHRLLLQRKPVPTPAPKKHVAA